MDFLMINNLSVNPRSILSQHHAKKIDTELPGYKRAPDYQHKNLMNLGEGLSNPFKVYIYNTLYMKNGLSTLS